ncbi:unnamed protein product [Sympodiomycopsis kandeliae]
MVDNTVRFDMRSACDGLETSPGHRAASRRGHRNWRFRTFAGEFSPLTIHPQDPSPYTSSAMVRYAFDDSKITEKVARSRSNYSRVHFKNTHEVVVAITGLSLSKAYTYLQNVEDRKQCIPFRKFNGGVGRTRQAAEFGTTQGRWPVKSVKYVVGLLKNAESNAEAKGLDTENLFVKNININQAPKTRRRTYRAHGRINPYEGHPSHIEIHLVEKSAEVPKAASDAVAKPANRRQLAQRRIAAARAA